MNSLVLLLVTFFLAPNTGVKHLLARHKLEPYVMLEREPDDCSQPCDRTLFFVKNPLSHPVRVTFICGTELTDVTAVVPAKDILGIDISQETSGKPRCFLLSWEKVR
jgi:hypothetical protein